jgi:hypothetical protein
MDQALIEVIANGLVALGALALFVLAILKFRAAE